MSFSLSGPHFVTKEVTASLLSPLGPAFREEGVSWVTASAAGVSTMQAPPSCPCPVMSPALGSADGEDSQIEKVTLHVNGRGHPFVQPLECLCLVYVIKGSTESYL